MSNPSSRFFGLKKNAVSKFLEDLTKGFEHEINEIVARVKEAKEVNRKLREECEKLEEQKQKNSIDDDTLIAATHRLPGLLKIIDRQHKEDLQTHYQDSKMMISKLESEYDKLTKEIANGQKLLDLIISQYSNVIENLSSINNIERDFKLTSDDDDGLKDMLDEELPDHSLYEE